MKKHDAFKARYMTGELVHEHGPLRLQVASVTMQSMLTSGKPEDKPVMAFVGDSPALVLNGINWDTFEGAWGPDSDRWIGLTVELHAVRVQVRGKEVWAIRVRPLGSPDSALDTKLSEAV